MRPPVNIEAIELRSNIQDKFEVLLEPGAVQRHLPVGWSVQVSSYYRGGSLHLSTQGREVLEVSVDAEGRHRTVSIPPAFKSREMKLLSFLSGVADRLEADREEQLRAAREAAEQVHVDVVAEAIDNLPEF